MSSSEVNAVRSKNFVEHVWPSGKAGDSQLGEHSGTEELMVRETRRRKRERCFKVGTGEAEEVKRRRANDELNVTEGVKKQREGGETGDEGNERITRLSMC